MSTTESRFVELVRSWLVSLPHDLKIAFEAMDDENLPREGRELATGAVIYVVSPNDFVSDRNEAVSSYVDDVILLRLALLELVTSGDEDAAALRDRLGSYDVAFTTLAVLNVAAFALLFLLRDERGRRTVTR